MTLPSVSPYRLIQHLTFNSVEVSLQALFHKISLPNWHDRLQDFAQQQKIPPETLICDGRRWSLPNFAEIALQDVYRFLFQRELTGPAVTHQAIVYTVRGRYHEVIPAPID
jgi:hypothetical protein